MTSIHGSGDLFKDYENLFTKIERDFNASFKAPFQDFGEFSPVLVILSTRPVSIERDWGRNNISLLHEITIVGKLRKSGLGVRESARRAGDITKTFNTVLNELLRGQYRGKEIPVEPKWSSAAEDIRPRRSRSKRKPEPEKFEAPGTKKSRSEGTSGTHRAQGRKRPREEAGTAHGAYGAHGAEGIKRRKDAWTEYLDERKAEMKKHENQPAGSAKYQEVRERILKAGSTPASIIFGDPVPANFTEKDVNSAYRKISVTVHPDRNPGSQEAEEIFKIINEAKKRLLDQLEAKK